MNYAIILAGGKGVRFEGNIPKQFVELMGEPLLVHSMKTAQENDNVDAICVVSSKEYYDWVRMWADKYHITKLLFVAEAGRERYQSVHSGLKSLPARADDTVIIMTAVCPFVSQLTVDKLYKAMETKDACITVVKATDAITFSNNGESVLRTLQKKKLFIQQGPQLFRYGILEQAYKAYLSDENRTEVNEDSELVLNIGVECGMVMGDRFCVKVTYPEDLAIVEALYPLFIKQETKIGERM
ncbi:IspD/TarI family cytidylyltransferase [Enterocloster clostridioformis]|uniref:2-C-methyl-D-erythritol 4-phosphate cytidylyltransferase n=1 Tax=[Clostridium] clostridioforme 90A8 TaxID=999408 RepID=A0A0E2HET1_9FIRM|nr:IspD/TarI family cytidylyltransferase [Enterocloster clostridioformis]ENZ18761.1 2-C-methyl-D-erythritol 4-phosphate cytidylyltransferase [[Clostridium] clostridioforme 90A8]